MITCPCCTNSLLRHVRHGSVYLFCRYCWAEMPALAQPDDVKGYETQPRPASDSVRSLNLSAALPPMQAA